MNRHVASWIVVSVVMLSMVAVLPAIGYAQQDGSQFSVQWKDAPVADVLSALQRQFGIQYVLPSELGSRRISLSLSNVTPVQALQHILGAANLTAVNQNSVWHIREIAQAEIGGRTYRPGAAAGAAAQPAPYRPSPLGVNVGGLGMSGMSMGLQPGATSLGGTGLTTLGMQQTLQSYSPADLIFRIIPLKFVDPYIITDMFGGGTVGGDSSGSGGSQGGYGSNRDDRNNRDDDRDRSARSSYGSSGSSRYDN